MAQFTKRETTIPKMLSVYLDGLDASVDGHGFDAKHEDARVYVETAINSHDVLLAALRRALFILESSTMPPFINDAGVVDAVRAAILSATGGRR